MRLPDDVPKIAISNSHNQNGNLNSKSVNSAQNGNSSNRNSLSNSSSVLPIDLVRQELVEHARKNDTLIVMGETGSGKSTKLPQFLQDARSFYSIKNMS